jgi:ribosomal protein S18 acetylase RimI-like enzyme
MTITDMIRPLISSDVDSLKKVIDGTGLFPPEMLDGMLEQYLAGDAQAGQWLTFDDGHKSAIAYVGPERMTEGTWNLFLIAVHPDRQGKGIGTALMRHVELRLAARGARILLVETSDLPQFERTRRFYKHIGYQEEARIRDYYKSGEGKIVFRKTLKVPQL